MLKNNLNSKQISETWSRFDSNGNKKLSLAEIDLAVINLLPQFANDKPALMRAYRDCQEHGFVYFKDFEKLLQKLVFYDQIFKKFQKLDLDKDRRLDFTEFKKGFKILGLSLNEDELKAAFKEADRDGFGMVLFEEFCLFLAKMHPSK